MKKIFHIPLPEPLDKQNQKIIDAHKEFFGISPGDKFSATLTRIQKRLLGRELDTKDIHADIILNNPKKITKK